MSELLQGLRSLLDNTAEPFEKILKNALDCRVIKNTSLSRVVLFSLPENPESRLVYKEISGGKTIGRRLRKSFSTPVCIKEERNSRVLWERGFRVPEPITALARRKWGIIRFSGYFSREIPELNKTCSLRNCFSSKHAPCHPPVGSGSSSSAQPAGTNHGNSCTVKTLNNYLSEYRREKEGVYSLRYKRKLLRTLGETVGKLHNGFFYHGDLRANHLVLSLFSPEPEIGFIDCEAARIYNKKNRNWLIRDLRKLRKSTKGFQSRKVFTNCDKLRFFQGYASGNNIERSQYKDYFRLINEPRNEWDS
ncbi:MAG: lipopolysaccharide kinase InaA family protein [bacterium]